MVPVAGSTATPSGRAPTEMVALTEKVMWAADAAGAAAHQAPARVRARAVRAAAHRRFGFPASMAAAARCDPRRCRNRRNGAREDMVTPHPVLNRHGPDDAVSARGNNVMRFQASQVDALLARQPGTALSCCQESPEKVSSGG